MSKIYKYVPIDKAKLILESDSILLNNPSNFNDPFDCVIVQDKEDVEKCDSLIKKYAAIKIIMTIVEQKNKCNLKGKEKVLYSKLQRLLEKAKNKLTDYPYFEGIDEFEKFYNKYCEIDNNAKIILNECINELKKELNSCFEKIKKNIFVGCFSEINNSILMWAHYAKNHTGVCIEYENNGLQNFNKVNYSSEKPKVKLYKILTNLLGLDMIGKLSDIFNHIDDYKYLTNGYYIKAIDWAYEKEIRFVYYNTESNEFVIKKEDNYFYKMPIPTKIYIGCRVNKEELEPLIKLARSKNIPICYMKDSDEEYIVIEDKNIKVK